MSEITLASTITCPECGFKTTEIMPTDQCVWYWQCSDCRTVLRPNKGDCCVYCSFGDMPCPPVQLNGKTGCCNPSEES